MAIAARSSAPLIVTVFAGEPLGGASEFAAFQHERWGLNAETVTQVRRDEDLCAALALGASVRTVWLEFLDAIYRDERYSSDNQLFSRILDDECLVEEVAASLATLDGDEYVVPLGIGNHVDHQITFQAGQRLASEGASVWAYADVPYALSSGIEVNPSHLECDTDPRLVTLDDEAQARRWDAIECYASQLPVIFRHLGDPRVALEAFGVRVGHGAVAEAFWRVLPRAD